MIKEAVDSGCTFAMRDLLPVDMSIDCLADAPKRGIESGIETFKSAARNAIDGHIHSCALSRQTHPLNRHLETSVGTQINSGTHFEVSIDVVPLVCHRGLLVGCREILTCNT
ncbi:MAG: hypothetical protein ACTHKE_03420 [Sphingomicrobium sp.]